MKLTKEDKQELKAIVTSYPHDFSDIQERAIDVMKYYKFGEGWQDTEITEMQVLKSMDRSSWLIGCDRAAFNNLHMCIRRTFEGEKVLFDASALFA